VLPSYSLLTALLLPKSAWNEAVAVVAGRGEIIDAAGDRALDRAVDRPASWKNGSVK